MSVGTDTSCSYSEPTFVILLVKSLPECSDVYSKCYVTD